MHIFIHVYSFTYTHSCTLSHTHSHFHSCAHFIYSLTYSFRHTHSCILIHIFVHVHSCTYTHSYTNLTTLCVHENLPFIFIFMCQFVFIFRFTLMFHEHIYKCCIFYIFLVSCLLHMALHVLVKYDVYEITPHSYILIPL